MLNKYHNPLKKYHKYISTLLFILQQNLIKKNIQANQEIDHLAFFQTNPLHTPLFLYIWSTKHRHILTIYAYILQFGFLQLAHWLQFLKGSKSKFCNFGQFYVYFGYIPSYSLVFRLILDTV